MTLSLQLLALSQMTVAQCEAAQVSLLYPWEKKLWDENKSVFDIRFKLSERGMRYMQLEARALDALEEDLLAEGDEST